jgi:hypothetical protein
MSHHNVLCRWGGYARCGCAAVVALALCGWRFAASASIFCWVTHRLDIEYPEFLCYIIIITTRNHHTT